MNFWEWKIILIQLLIILRDGPWSLIEGGMESLLLFVCYQNFTFPPHILLASFHPNMEEEDQRISKMSNFVQEFEDDEQFQSAGGSQHSICSPNPTENGGSTPTTSTTSKKKRNLPGNPGKKNLFILLSKCHGYVQDNNIFIRKC